MAVSGKTAAPHLIPYFVGSDAPPDMGDVTEAMAERLHERLDDIAPSQITTAGAGDEAKLLVVQNTGAPAFKALSGDVTVNAAGVAEIGAGKVGATELADLGVSTGKINNKAVTLGKLAEGLGLTEGYFANGAVGAAKLAADAKRLFPQLVAALVGADHKVNFGSATTTTGTKIVAHDLGATPAVVFLTPRDSKTMYVGVRDGTNFTAHMVGGDDTFDWFAIS